MEMSVSQLSPTCSVCIYHQAYNLLFIHIIVHCVCICRWTYLPAFLSAVHKEDKVSHFTLHKCVEQTNTMALNFTSLCILSCTHLQLIDSSFEKGELQGYYDFKVWHIDYQHDWSKLMAEQSIPSYLWSLYKVVIPQAQEEPFQSLKFTLTGNYAGIILGIMDLWLAHAWLLQLQLSKYLLGITTSRYFTLWLQ